MPLHYAIYKLLSDCLDSINAIKSTYKTYMSEDQLENKGVVNKANPVDIEVFETLGRTAKYGFIYSETGTLIVKVNEGGAPIPLKAADFFDIHDQHLEVEKLRIETESVADITFRLLLV